MSNAPFIVGIDLGTTNTVLSYVDMRTPEDKREIRVFSIPQLIAPGIVEPCQQLPSFLYLAAEAEFSPTSLDLPWADARQFAVGEFAREHGGKVPRRLVVSAKSWLCHPTVDRNAPILPHEAPEEVPRLSPVEASTRYLEHLRDTWNTVMASADESLRLEGQEIFITVPASFDAVARELTIAAATRSGLSSVTLLEEPQAAFYAWLAAHTDSWRETLHVGDRVLVCDVGGGTTDFTLIAVRDADGKVELERVAVGDHILLGGDNVDLALALVVSQRLPGADLDAWQTRALWHECRRAKERLLSDPTLEKEQVTILGRGSKVIGGSMTSEVTRADIDMIVCGGFFPACGLEDHPATSATSGLSELGLPYAQDAAITKYLAKFLSAHGGSAQLPTAVLFNGGIMKAPELRESVMQTLSSWAEEYQPKELTAANFDTACAQGAAYYGMVRQGKGVRIRGGVARSYYIGIESSMPAVPGLSVPLKALCVVPFGMEEGSEADVKARQFAMTVGQPVTFRFLSSTTRKEDASGALLDRWSEGELEELSPIQTEFSDEASTKESAQVPVTLHAAVTEVGTLDLSLIAEDGRSWKLEYNVRYK